MSITIQHIQEELNKSYVSAVAAKAGVKCTWESLDYGIDGRIIGMNIFGKRRIQSAFGISIQIKSTINWSVSKCGKNIIYDIEVKTFDDLKQFDPDGEGALLILMCLPKKETDWLEITHDNLLMRNCCYWWKHDGAETKNKNSVRIQIPKSNLLNSVALNKLLDDEKNRRKGNHK